MALNFRSAERIRRLAPRTTLRRRPDSLLPFLGAEAVAGHGLLLDTCVYVDQIQDKLPKVVEDLIAARTTSHSAVAIQELMHTVGVLDPDDVRSERAVAEIRAVIEAMPSHRIFVPDAATLAEAAVYAGTLCRIQGYAKDNRMSALHDCALFLQAMKLGLVLLTRNVRDFDFLLQLRRTGRVLFYRT